MTGEVVATIHNSTGGSQLLTLSPCRGADLALWRGHPQLGACRRQSRMTWSIPPTLLPQDPQ